MCSTFYPIQLNWCVAKPLNDFIQNISPLIRVLSHQIRAISVVNRPLQFKDHLLLISSQFTVSLSSIQIHIIGRLVVSSSFDQAAFILDTNTTAIHNNTKCRSNGYEYDNNEVKHTQQCDTNCQLMIDHISNHRKQTHFPHGTGSYGFWTTCSQCYQ